MENSIFGNGSFVLIILSIGGRKAARRVELWSDKDDILNYCELKMYPIGRLCGGVDGGAYFTSAILNSLISQMSSVMIYCPI